jgi:hypothetical protein
MLRKTLGLAGAVLAALVAGPVWAGLALPEEEPNDTPQTANRVSGAVRVIASMPSGDQDAYLWQVSDVDALKRWTLRLDGIAGALTIVEVMRLEYGEDGVTPTGRQKLFTLGSRDGSRPAVAEDLMLEPGEYLLGAARAGGKAPFRPPVASVSFGDEADSPPRESAGGASGAPAAAGDGYRLAVVAGDGFEVAQGAMKGAAKDQAIELRPERAHAGLFPSEQAWFAFTVTEAQSKRGWNLDGQVPVGRTLRLTLHGVEGAGPIRVTGDKHGLARLSELVLAPGRYHVQLESDPGTLRRIALAAGGARAEGGEAEPNDQWAIANRVDFGVPVTGALQARNDTDHFVFVVDEAAAEQRLALAAEASGEAAFTICLLDGRGRSQQCRTGVGLVRLDDLALPAGEYGLSLGRGAQGVTYAIRLETAGPHEPGQEGEPNDVIELASGIAASGRVAGAVVRDDVDYHRLLVDGEPQLWRVQVMGEGIHEVAYHDGSGTEGQKIRARAGDRRITLDNLFLLPGVHYVSVRGNAPGTYNLRARPLGPPDPDAEREPNDDTTRMQPLRVGQTRTGTLPDAADRDNYRFRLGNHDRIRLVVRPPADGAVRALLYWDETSVREARGNAAGQPLVLEGLFPPGDYRLELIAEQPSDTEYALSLERLARFGCPVDCEPNDDPAFAATLAADGRVEGSVGEWRDEDWYALPVQDRSVDVRIEGQQRQQLDLVAHPNDRGGLAWDRERARYAGTIPAGEQRYLRIRGEGAYRFQVVLGEEAPPVGERPPPAVTLNAAFEHAAVAAYQPFGQRLTGRLTVRNAGPDAAELSLEAATSDARWTVALEASSLRLAGGETRDIPVRVQVPDDAWGNRPVRVSIAARDGRGLGSETFADIAVDRDAPLIGPVRHWRVPASLRGGLNVAWQALGGRMLGSDDSKLGQGLTQIFDGMVARGEGLALRGSQQPWAYHSTVALAGEQPTRVSGIALDPQGRTSLQSQLRRFELSLSDDGETFHPVLRGTLAPRPVEQYFELPEPVAARFARLQLIDDFTGHPGGTRGLGEWKVIATPGDDPTGGAGFDLADPNLGGHVVWSRPQISPRWDDAILQPASARQRVRVRAGVPLQWVVGFQHNRAARIQALEWLDSAGSVAGERIGAVEVSVSTDSPVGPWSPVATWELAGRDARRLTLDAPVWARYVRFATTPLAADAQLEAPGAIRIFEQPADADYRSILGVWGTDDQRAAYEASRDIAPAPPFRRAAHGSRAAAAPLTANRPVAGRVWLGQHEHWYRLDVPGDRNTLDIRLAGEPTLRTVLTLETAAGEPVPLRERRRSAAEQWLEAFVTPGEAVYLKVEEPPRNVVFAWDTSASVGAYLPVIYSALAAYAGDLVPGRDSANLMPFGSRMLLRDWTAEPYLMQTVLNEYPRGESSSAAETTLARAGEALAGRAGAKAVVLITDAATNRDPRVWDVFDQVRPRVFSLGLDSRGAFGRHPVREQDLLQDWAGVNGGHYAPLRNEGELEVAFERAATLLREPADYRLTVAAEFREAPGPGELQVRSGAAGAASAPAAGAVHFILDASGSMLQRIDGVRRIQIARQVLLDAVRARLAPGTPVALRVFGHKEPNACRSDLELPLGPLEPAAAGAVIGRIEAQNLARTPIADALARVEGDLARAAGPRTVVLLTDGEETCGGDPEAAIRALLDKGIDLRLNIVGFALNDEALEGQFEAWAELGGGRYFTAADAAGLSAALDDALRVPFTVYDHAGGQVAAGLVDGAPVVLPPGRYRVAIGSAPPRTVDVPGGEVVTLDVD